jgi:hypothetical protein
MPTVTITIEAPEGFTISVDQQEVGAPERAGSADRQAVERYFRDYLSDNGRELYRAAARREQDHGPDYTLSELASDLKIGYSSAQSMHRTSGRSARRWKAETKTEAPIQLIDTSYDYIPEEGGRRTRYRLPAGVAEIIGTLE